MGIDHIDAPSKPLSPKQREIRDRPGLILKVARALIDNEGFTAVTIDRLAKEMSCSRPPIYEHFTSREDVVIGLTIEDTIQRWKLLKRAATFDGRAREKLVAMNEFTFRTYPEHLKILCILQPNSVREKATKSHRETLEDYEARAFDLLTRVVEEAIEDGDVVIPGCQSAAMISYPLLCLTFGGNTFESRNPYWPLQQRQFNRHLAARLGFLAVLDGFNWKPLSLEWDYIDTIGRARKELDIDGYIEETTAEKASSQ